jgi:beta-xylosidase
MIFRTAILPVFVASLALAAPERYKTWGDLGDGTYANPVLNGDFADVDIEKFGDTYYLITSCNHLSPAMTIMESKDLVNWKYTGHAIPSLNWHPRYNWDQMNGYSWGNWAGDLVYRDGEWLCYQIDFQFGLTMTKAKNIEGPWSEPVVLMERTHWSDPAVYFDEEKKEAWLLCNWGRGIPPDNTKPNEQKLFKLSWAGDKLLDEGTVVFKAKKTEAAKLRKFNGEWYIMCIEWVGHDKTTRDRKQLCLRSTSGTPFGPYEKRTVYNREKVGERSACQGSLIQAPDESWWFMHQLIQNGKPVFHGRPQCLQPAVWKDGFPIIGADTDGDGTGIPVWHHKKPAPQIDTDYELATSAEFDSTKLGHQWNWNHNPRNERWSLSERAGWLRITASKPVGKPKPIGQFWKAPNTLSQRHLGVGDGYAETKVDLSGFMPGTFAGLCHFSGKYALCGVREDADGKRWIVARNMGNEEKLPLPDGDQIYLRSDWSGDQASFSWSVDGEDWRKLKTKYTLMFGKWRGNRPGVFCFNTSTDDFEEAGHADFDYFHHEYSR